MKRNRKWKIPHMLSERWILCFGSCKNHKLKVELWWVGARERKKSAFFVMFILSERDFFNICVLAQCTIYSVLNKLSEYKYFYIWKNITSYTFLSVFKIAKGLQCILKGVLYLIKLQTDHLNLTINSTFPLVFLIFIMNFMVPNWETHYKVFLLTFFYFLKSLIPFGSFQYRFITSKYCIL